MSAHVAVPALTGDPTVPATLSRTVRGGTLRDRFSFGGLTISDALDMQALAQGAAQAVETIAAIRAGIDLLLCAPDRSAQRRIEETLGAAGGPRLVRTGTNWSPRARAWPTFDPGSAAAGPPPDLDVVGPPDHRLSRANSRNGR